MDMVALIAEVEASIHDVNQWEPQDDPVLAKRGARGYVGTANGWRLLIVRWPITNETYGYDGTATHIDGRIVHLTKDLAEKAARAIAHQT